LVVAADLKLFDNYDVLIDGNNEVVSSFGEEFKALRRAARLTRGVHPTPALDHFLIYFFRLINTLVALFSFFF